MEYLIYVISIDKKLHKTTLRGNTNTNYNWYTSQYFIIEIMNTDSKQHRGHWNRKQHKEFIKALEMHGKNWKKIQEVVKTRTISQVRSHAQKYFLQLKKDKSQDWGESCSEQVSYKDQSSFHDSSLDQRGLLQKNQINYIGQNLQPPTKSNNLAEYLLKLCEECEAQSTNFNKVEPIPSQIQQSKTSANIFTTFTQKQLQNYIQRQQYPSFFLQTITHHYEYFTKGDNFMNL